MEKPRYEPFYRAGHEEKIGIVMACSPMIDTTRDRDSNDMFAPCLRGGVVTANVS